MSNTETTTLAPGVRILVRDEEWLVRSVKTDTPDGTMVKAVGVSEFVQDMEATFFTGLETVQAMEPEDTVLVQDASSQFRQSRLFLEAVLRRTPLPRSEKGLALADRFLLDPLTYQQRPVELALAGLRPRILIADVVGLGKTLEIGLILAELIRRGRGERILVVSPQQVLEQFQRELWTRFSIPLVRLDSTGIQRIQQEIPAGRNPFTYFKRAIISVDTLKDAGQFGHHLDAIEWDAVVIDESHNLINKGTKRNELAQKLAGRTDALLLASATPHNGDRESFAELISMLEPAAIKDKKNYTADEIKDYYLRRTKISPEVRDQMGDRWADRGPSQQVRCLATEAEEQVFQELTDVWMSGAWSDEPVRGQNRLFPYTLLKSFLSSHRALAATVAERRRKTDSPTEEQNLKRLTGLIDRISDDDSSKLAGLVTELKKIGIGPRGSTRVVVFSERVPTLKWLAEAVPQRLGLKPNAVRVMHGGLTDTEEQKILQEFELEGSDVRLLFTGDVASEGVNLHRQCHHLIHYDIPWSLIRIEQRNGRVDRYGQRHEPQFRALILTSGIENAKDDRTVAEKLLKREENAHRSLGSVEAALGVHDAKAEEDRLVRDLLSGRTVDESYEQGFEVDVLADLMAGVSETPAAADVPIAHVPRLFASTEEFADAALRELYDDRPEDAIDLRREEELLTFLAPDDLVYRLSDLPKSYLQAHREGDRLRLKVTFDRKLAQRKLDEARQAKTTSWPDIAFLSDVHPMIDWLIDKVLIRLGRQQAPVLTANVDDPVFLVQGVYANKLGQPTVVEWMAVTGLPGEATVTKMDDVLEAAGVGPQMVNRAEKVDLETLQKLVPDAVAAARAHLAREREDWEQQNTFPLESYRAKLDGFAAEQTSLFQDLPAAIKQQRTRRSEAVVKQQRDLVERLETIPDPLLRVLAVLVKPGEGVA
ncbi:putative DEAD/DEAH box helicase [Actinoplanes missouriensis 431]|uniref:Putative DEAD/DEAH box helicase n=1 Tax=Actinoplanes missouriensis (strain ATCC 14538 / DSM 43046 / CBS 188.64 / JCM 3121 / NBRC 102363 / NCIMB 12654 / NRRL B-3342 / UNCC 431) TaxID=512565 RepID=I0HE08_ACTM4|nr:helicase-related protein [Actinoplanes missouriensis]BAL91245.1 putative DEAD/DEAH box helicase [Actinoplanes missouriensis 431]